MADISTITLPSGTTYNIKDAVIRGLITAGTGSHSAKINALGSDTETTDFNVASGGYALVVGQMNEASGDASFASGVSTVASGEASHAEGNATIAEGVNSHAEGSLTTARGTSSHAEGYGTTAKHAYQHVFGEWNITDPSSAAITARGTYVEIVGNGTASNAKSNARTLDWSGNEVLAGKLTLGVGPSANMDAATKTYVDTEIANNISSLSGAMKYIGTTTTALTDGSTTNPITISGSIVTATAGNVAIYGEKEFVFNGTKWQEFGSTGSLKALAFKDTASGNVSVTGTPSGTVSRPTFSGTQGSVSVSGTPSGSVTISTGTGTANYTPAGTVTQPTFTGSSGSVSVSGTPSGSVTIGTGTGTANYTPAGSISTPTITVTPSKSTKYVASSTTGGGSVTAGSAASCTLPAFTATVSNENLTLGWSAGSFTANTPTAVTLPSFSSASLVTGISSATSTQPSFTGTAVKLTGTFSGNSLTSTGSFTPSGTVSQPTFSGTGVQLKGSFSGNSLTSTGNFTPAGTVSQPTFSGSSLTSTGSVTVS